MVKPVSDSAQAAGRCLDPKAATPCGVGEAYELVQRFETQKRSVREAKWTLRTFLRSAERNEISAELIPKIQAQLFQRNVLAPLLASFDARARAQGLWDQHGGDYVSFRDGFAQLLRFKRLSSATAHRGPHAPCAAAWPSPPCWRSQGHPGPRSPGHARSTTG